MDLSKLKSIAVGIAKSAIDNRTGLIDLALKAAALVHSNKDDRKAFAKKVLDGVQTEIHDEVKKGVQFTIDEFESKRGVDIPDDLETALVEAVAEACDFAFDNILEQRILTLFG